MPRLARALAMLAALPALSALVGWRFDIPVLRRVSPDWPVMVPNTALFMLLLSVAALSISVRRAGRLLVGVISVSAVVVMVISLTTLFEYAIGRDSTLDTRPSSLLVAPGLPDPGDPSPVTCLAALLMALAVLTRDIRLRRGVLLSEACAIGAGLIATVTFVGYLFGVSELYSFTKSVGMSILTASCVLLNASAILLLLDHSRVLAMLQSNDAAGAFCRRALPLVVFVPIVAGFVRLRLFNAGLTEFELGLVLYTLFIITLAGLGVLLIARSLRTIEERRHETQSALSRAEAQFRAMVDASPLAIFMSDAAGNNIYTSRSYFDISGYHPSELQGANWDKAVHPDDHDRMGREWLRAVSSARPYTGACRLLRPDGATVWVSIKAAPMRDNGSTIGWVGTVEDVSEQIHAQDELKRQSRQLESARIAADTANRAKGEFLANMSHEIRTPMTSILGYSSLLLNRELPESDRRDFAATIRRNGEHLLTVLNDVLDFSKIEAGKLSLERLACSPATVIEDVASLMRVRATEKRLSVEVEHQNPLPQTITTDPTRLRQILLNLVSNAIKFTDAGGVIIRTRSSGGPDAALLISVTDTGCGMSEAQLSGLFQSFAQADSSTTRRFGGSGLGLAISRRLAMLLGGSLTVNSATGRGTTFTLSLPITSLLPINAPLVPLDAHEDQPAPTLVRGLVLLAEDGPDNQRLIRHLLTLSGAEVEIASNGNLAIEAVRAAMQNGKAFDLILMDMQMPELDGYSAAAQLRAMGVTTPIVALTAHSLSGDRERCLASGCTDYLAKPFGRADLITLVAKYLKPQTSSASCGLSGATLEDTDTRAIVHEFVASLPERIRKIDQALAAGELRELQRIAHQLKGSGGGYGFPKITEVAAEAERAIKSGAETGQIRQRVSQLCDVLRSVNGCDRPNLKE